MKKIIFISIVVVTCISIFCSCQSNGKNQIKTAADWVGFCETLDNDPIKMLNYSGGNDDAKTLVKKVDKCFATMDSETAISIVEDLLDQMNEQMENQAVSARMKSICWAFSWISAALAVHVGLASHQDYDHYITKNQAHKYADILKRKFGKDARVLLYYYVGEETSADMFLLYCQEMGLIDGSF